MEDYRFSWALVSDVLGVLESHGYQRGNNQDVGKAVGHLMDLVEAFEGKGE